MVAKLSGVFDGLLTTPINDFPITGSYPRNDSDATQRYALSDYLRAQRLEALGDPDQRRKQIEAGAVSKEQFDEAVLATSKESFQCLLEDMEQCLDEHDTMSDLLDEKCGVDLAPPATKTREAISDCISTLKHIAKNKLDQPPPSVEPGAEGAVATQEPSGKVIAVGGISNRDEAFQLLLKIADFFRENEPHSIVSYSLEQVVRWGRMSLPALMSELIDNKDTREQLFRHTGVFLDDGESSPPSG